LKLKLNEKQHSEILEGENNMFSLLTKITCAQNKMDNNELI